MNARLTTFTSNHPYAATVLIGMAMAILIGGAGVLMIGSTL